MSKRDRRIAALEAQIALLIEERDKKAKVEAPKGKTILTRTTLRAYKLTPEGKALRGVSVKQIRDGEVAMPKGFKKPKGHVAEKVKAHTAKKKAAAKAAKKAKKA